MTSLWSDFRLPNQQTSKLRPAAVVSNREYHQHKPDVILIAITSQIRSPVEFGETLIRDWQGAGLLKRSVLKPVLFTAEKTMLARNLGRLSSHDQQGLKNLLQKILD